MYFRGEPVVLWSSHAEGEETHSDPDSSTWTVAGNAIFRKMWRDNHKQSQFLSFHEITLMQWAAGWESLILCAGTLRRCCCIGGALTLVQHSSSIRSQKSVGKNFSSNHEQHWNSFFFSFHTGCVWFCLNLRPGIPRLTPALRSKSALQLVHFECVFHVTLALCFQGEKRHL